MNKIEQKHKEIIKLLQELEDDGNTPIIYCIFLHEDKVIDGRQNKGVATARLQGNKDIVAGMAAGIITTTMLSINFMEAKRLKDKVIEEITEVLKQHPLSNTQN